MKPWQLVPAQSSTLLSRRALVRAAAPAAPHIVAHFGDALEDRVRHDRRRHGCTWAKLEFLAQAPAERAGRPGYVAAGDVVRHRVQVLALALEQVGGSRGVRHSVSSWARTAPQLTCRNAPRREFLRQWPPQPRTPSGQA